MSPLIVIYGLSGLLLILAMYAVVLLDATYLSAFV